MGDAAARTVEAGSSDSRFEAVDVDGWLEEADQINRVRKLGDPDTRQFKMEDLEEEAQLGDDDSTELSVGDSDTDSSERKRKLPDKKQKPGKMHRKMSGKMHRKM